MRVYAIESYEMYTQHIDNKKKREKSQSFNDRQTNITYVGG